MFDASLPYEPDPDARAARRLAMVHRLAEIGLELVEAAHRQALAQLEGQDSGAEDDAGAEADAPKARRAGPLATVERLSRIVRLNLALEARLDEGEPVRRARMRAEAKAARQAEKDASLQAIVDRSNAESIEAARLEEERQEIVVEVVTQALEQAECDPAEVLERIGEVRERLDEVEREFDVSVHPVGAVIAKLFKAMEIEPDWSVWAGEDWAIEEARTNAPGSPYAAGPGSPPADVADAEASPSAPIPELADALGQSP